MRRCCLLALTVVIALLTSTLAQGAVGVYITGPYGPPGNVTAMDEVFPGSWTPLGFSDPGFNASVTGILTTYGSCDLLYVEAYWEDDAFFGSFLSNHGAELADWVAHGGSVFLNSAGSSANTFSIFGMTLQQAGYGSLSENGAAVTPGHSIFAGLGTLTWTTTYFSHDTVAGGTALISGDVGTVLAETTWGDGHVMIGGMTGSYNSDTHLLRENILRYAAGESNWPTAEVPEPSTLAVFIGLGAIGVVVPSRRRNRLAAAPGR